MKCLWLLFMGQDVKTGKRIIEYRDPSQNRERAGYTPGSEMDRWYTSEEVAEFSRRWRENDFPDEPGTLPASVKTEETNQEPSGWLSKICCCGK